MLKMLRPALALVLLTFATPAFANPEIGKPAPEFTATDSKGVSHSLSSFKGKPVVLEWTNADCPYVRKHYDAGNMQKLQKDAVDGGAVWLTINSSAQGQQGHVDGAGADAIVEKEKANPTAYLLDADGTVGKLYGAKTTPHMYVIDAEGNLAYMGAIDDRPTADKADIEGANNYVTAALASLAKGEAVKDASTQAYGCGVKYKN